MEPEVNPAEVTVDDAVEEAAVELSSEGKKPKDSTEPELLTKEQVDKLFNERQSKLDRRIFELEKANERSSKTVEAAASRAKVAEESLALAKKELEDAERRSLGDSPDALTLFEAKVKHKQVVDALDEKIRKFEDEKTEWEDAISEAKQYKLIKVADEIASEYEVDSELLVSMTDGSREKMEKLAKVLPKKTSEDKPTFVKPPDSGKKSKVLTNPTIEQLNSMSMERYAEYVAERDKNKR